MRKNRFKKKDGVFKKTEMPIRGGISFLKNALPFASIQIPLNNTMPSPYSKKIVKKLGKFIPILAQIK